MTVNVGTTGAFHFNNNYQIIQSDHSIIYGCEIFIILIFKRQGYMIYSTQLSYITKSEYL